MNFLVTLLTVLLTAVQTTTATAKSIWEVVKILAAKIPTLEQVSATLKTRVDSLQVDTGRMQVFMESVTPSLSTTLTDVSNLKMNSQRIEGSITSMGQSLTTTTTRLDGRIDGMLLAATSGMKGFLVLKGLEIGSKGGINKLLFTKGSGQYIVNIEMKRDANGNLSSDGAHTLISSAGSEMPMKENENLIVEFDATAGTYTFVTKDSNSIGRVEADLSTLKFDFQRFMTEAKPVYEKQTVDMKAIGVEADALLALIKPFTVIPPTILQPQFSAEPMQVPVAPDFVAVENMTNAPVTFTLG